MSDCNKNRVLALYNILSKYTDIHHQMSMKEIVARMELNGYPCSEGNLSGQKNDTECTTAESTYVAIVERIDCV